VPVVEEHSPCVDYFSIVERCTDCEVTTAVAVDVPGQARGDAEIRASLASYAGSLGRATQSQL